MPRKVTRTDAEARAAGIKLPVRSIPPQDFPRTGLIRLMELASHSGDLGMFPQSPNTWIRRVAAGEYPPPVKIGAVNYWHAEYVRAVVAGVDWRKVQIDRPEVAAE
jgi:hypothetical protein